jgi:hypothetical protein
MSGEPGREFVIWQTRSLSSASAQTQSAGIGAGRTDPCAGLPSSAC